MANAPTGNKETVTVACKMPHGLILRLFDMIPTQEPMPGGGFRDTKRAQVRGETYKLNGYLEKYRPDLPPAARGSSFALTHGIPKDFWDQWVKDNQDLAVVRNNLVFAAKDVASVESKVLELDRETRTGLEPLDPSNLKKNHRVESFKADG